MTILVGDYRLDASLSEDHSFDTEISEYPVESGTTIADHIRLRPVSVTLEFVVSDTPLGTILTVRSGALALEEAGEIDKILPSEEALAVLLAIWQDRSPITIVTALRTYDNMVLESLTIPKNAENGHSLRGSARFKQIQIITNRRVTVKTAEPRGQGKKSLGPKPSDRTFPETTTWVCPPGIDVSNNINTNVKNRCGLVRRRADGKNEYVGGAPLTNSELTAWNQQLQDRGLLIDSTNNTVESVDGIPITRDVNGTWKGAEGYQPTLIGDSNSGVSPPAFDFPPSSSGGSFRAIR